MATMSGHSSRRTVAYPRRMKCIKCENEAQAVCQFCGRAVCADHIEERRFVSGYSTKAGVWNFMDTAVKVEDAVSCGVCHPEYFSTG